MKPPGTRPRSNGGGGFRPASCRRRPRRKRSKREPDNEGVFSRSAGLLAGELLMIHGNLRFATLLAGLCLAVLLAASPAVGQYKYFEPGAGTPATPGAAYPPGPGSNPA